MTTQHQNAVRGLYISAIVFASVGMLSKLMGAMGLGMFDPVSLMKQNVVNVGGKSIPVPGAARVASVMNFLMDSLLSLAVLLIAIAIGLQNNYFNKQSDGYEHHEGSDEHHEGSDEHYENPDDLPECPNGWGCAGYGEGAQCHNKHWGVLTCGGGVRLPNKSAPASTDGKIKGATGKCMMGTSTDGMLLWGNNKNQAASPCLQRQAQNLFCPLGRGMRNACCGDDKSFNGKKCVDPN